MKRTLRIVVPLMLAGCSALTSFDALVGEEPNDAGAGDASVTDASTADGSMTATTSDGGDASAANDASSQVPSDADAAPTDAGADVVLRYCQTVSPAPVFCDDFDGTETFGSTWTRTKELNGATVISSAAFSKSAPRSARHDTPLQDSGVAVSTLEYDLGPNTTYVHFSFDVMVKVRPSSGQLEIADLTLSASGVGVFYTDLLLRASSNDSYHEEFASPDGSFFSGDQFFTSLPSSSWRHVDMIVDLNAKTYVFKLNGTVQYMGPTRFGVAPGFVSVHSGVDYAGGVESPWTIYIDNVVIDTK